MSAVITCPSCEEEYLHHVSVNVFIRDEDSTNGLHIKMDYQTQEISADGDLSLIPPTRRDGMFIDFECEDCDCKPRLYIYQSKGSTRFDWNLMSDMELNPNVLSFEKESIN